MFLLLQFPTDNPIIYRIFPVDEEIKPNRIIDRFDFIVLTIR